MKASGAVVHPSSPHPEHQERNSFGEPKAEVVKEASSESGELEETMEVSLEGTLKGKDDTGTQDVVPASDFIVLRCVTMAEVCELFSPDMELLRWGRAQLHGRAAAALL